MKRQQTTIMVIVGIGIFLMLLAGLLWFLMIVTEIGLARNRMNVNTTPNYGLIFLLGLTGLAMVFGATLFGLALARRGPARLPTSSEAWVTARYGVDRQGVMYFDIDDPFDDFYKLYARLQFPDGSSAEFKLPPELYTYCAEGAFGKVEVDGDHIARFVPYVGERVRTPGQIDV
ncbi:MAG: hypothetical protein ACK4P3_02060 [Fimbriimonadaceae bacterium]